MTSPNSTLPFHLVDPSCFWVAVFVLVRNATAATLTQSRVPIYPVSAQWSVTARCLARATYESWRGTPLSPNIQRVPSTHCLAELHTRCGEAAAGCQDNPGIMSRLSAAIQSIVWTGTMTWKYPEPGASSLYSL